jgi:hypothetical protein
MPVWSQPQDLKTWMRRGVSFRGAVLVLAVAAVLISEVRFSWVEILVGRYLAATNEYRPESGSVWEQGRLKRTATQSLDQMVTHRMTAQREAREAASLTQLIEGLTASRGIMISAAQFRFLYSQVPPAAAKDLFSPILMLRISAGKSWERVYLERENGQVGIYLLDRDNNVISYTAVNAKQLHAVDSRPPAMDGALEDHPEFVGRIFPAERFFMALDALSPEIQHGVLARPGDILAAEGTPLRVGFSGEVENERIRIGIEMEAPRGRRVLPVMGQEWAVWQVRMLLEPRLSQSSSGKWKWPDNRADP